MRLDIDDGYTLTDATKPEEVNPDTGQPVNPYILPVVRFRYRPALPEALAEMRMRTRRANTGKEEVKAVADFLAAHLVEWDVVNKGEPAKIEAESIAKIGEPILNQILAIVARWAPNASTDRGNS